ncbi:MAG: ABC transporter ATP-binding protein [Chloroflexi bacterium]|nr:ABC transporter ATP-binding protein [Chloroflexota bacterium]
MSEWMIETRRLTKHYRKGGAPALDDLNLQVPAGALFGFIGPNGAGKTTTLRMLAGLLEPTSGEIWLAGEPLHQRPQALHHHIGYMPDFFGLYHEMSAWEYLDFFARCRTLPPARRRVVVDELLDLVGLAEKRDQDVGVLSRGMQQRLCLAQALVHDPAVLLLDEPASGLDPRARVEMRELLRELSALGKTIILSSHILSDLAEMCSAVAIVEHGRLVASGPLATLQHRAQPGRVVRLHLLDGPDQAQALLQQFPGVEDVARLNGGNGPGDAWLEVYLTGDVASAAALLAHLVQAGVAVAEFRQVGNELEELFLQLTTGQTA